MALLLDSATTEDAAAAAELGFVNGFTTNPTLMAKVTAEPLTQFERLLRAFPRGPACYQPTRSTPAELIGQARSAAALAPDRVVIKLPATLDGFRTAAILGDEGIGCAMTAVYSPAQALLAHEAGCAWAIPYVDRAARQGAGGVGLVDELAAILASVGSRTRILAASLKDPTQVTEAILHGAHDITASLAVLLSLASHPLSEAAVKEFDGAWA
jgi:transaldolase